MKYILTSLPVSESFYLYCKEFLVSLPASSEVKPIVEIQLES